MQTNREVTNAFLMFIGNPSLSLTCTGWLIPRMKKFFYIHSTSLAFFIWL
ncbi:hypothetical protein L579_2739 [Pantoea sp. AS-PWVM4]|nr:hypothetical protein L579_2739 [Pantoea sp. AS-PWVM4]